MRKRSASCEHVLAAPSLQPQFLVRCPEPRTVPFMSLLTSLSVFSVAVTALLRAWLLGEVCTEPSLLGRPRPALSDAMLRNAFAWILWGAGFCTPWSCDSDLALFTEQETPSFAFGQELGLQSLLLSLVFCGGFLLKV